VEKIITQCPHCSKKYKLGSEKVGKKIRCPNCKGVFEVQEVAAMPKTAPKPAATEIPPRPRPSQPEAAPAPPVAEAPPAPPAAEQQQPAPATQEVVSLEQRPRPLKVRDFMETQHMRFIPEKAQGVDIHVSYTFVEKGTEPEYWTVKIQNGMCEFTEGPDPSAKSQVKMKPETYLKMATNQLDPRVAFMLGKMKIKGDKASVASLRQCFNPPNVSKNDI
jgi:predicted Zn finger-like uncharacterized protein